MGTEILKLKNCCQMTTFLTMRWKPIECETTYKILHYNILLRCRSIVTLWSYDCMKGVECQQSSIYSIAASICKKIMTENQKKEIG